jgi:hypothetical protein
MRAYDAMRQSDAMAATRLRDLNQRARALGYPDAQTALLALEAKDEPAAYALPSDLERFKTAETTATMYSLAVTIIDTVEHTVPLFLRPEKR